MLPALQPEEHATGNEQVDDATRVTYVVKNMLGLTCAFTFVSQLDYTPFFWPSKGQCSCQSGTHSCAKSSATGVSRNICCCSAELAACPVSV